MELISPTDSMFLIGESREHPMHVAGLQLFEPPEGSGPDFIRDLHETIVKNDDFQPTFRKHPGRLLGGISNVAWAFDNDIDIDYHLRRSALPRPGRVRELLELTSRLHGTLLDRHRPLWEASLVEGLEDGRFAVYTKIHHSLLDGISAQRLMIRSMTPDPDDREIRVPWTLGPKRRSKDSGQSRSALQSITGAVGIGRLAGSVGTVAGQGRAGGTATDTAVPRAQDDVQRADRRSAAGGRAVVAAGAHPRDQVRGGRHRQRRRAGHVLGRAARLPHRSRRAAGHAAGRHGSGQPARRGRAGRGRQHGRHDPVQPGHRHRGPGQAAGRHQHLDARQQEGVRRASAKPGAGVVGVPDVRHRPRRWCPGSCRSAPPPFNIVISNVPGAREPMYWNGARLDGNYPLSIALDGQALNITLTNNADNLDFGLVGCRRSVPHLQRLLIHLEDSLADLEKAVGVGV